MNRIIQYTVFFFFLILFLACEKEDKSGHFSNEIEREIFELVNDHRVKEGVAPLVVNSFIQELAEGHTLEMASGTTPYGHDGFDDRADAIWNNVHSGLVGENVAKGYSSASAVVEGWLGSTVHRENIENASFKTTGIGAAKSEDGTWYYTQIFLSEK